MLLGSLVENTHPKINTAGNTTPGIPSETPVWPTGKFRTSALFLGHPRFSHLSFQFMAVSPFGNPQRWLIALSVDGSAWICKPHMTPFWEMILHLS